MNTPSLKIYIDGASRGNPGESAAGLVAFDGEGRELYRFGKRIGRGTNNSAEYAALLEALEYLERFERDEGSPPFVTICSDSELLVSQIKGHYKVQSEHLRQLFAKAAGKLRANPFVRVEHVKREDNRTADWIVKRVLDGKSYRPVDRSREGITPEESPGS